MQRFHIPLVVETDTNEIHPDEILARIDYPALEKTFTGKVYAQKVTEEFLFIFGGLLPNGATLRAIKPDYNNRSRFIVFAVQASGVDRFVTWVADKHGNCDHGHYFRGEGDALHDFNKRGNDQSGV